MKFFPLSLLIALLLTTGCKKEKNVPHGLMIAVEGTLTSVSTGKPLEGIYIAISGSMNGEFNNSVMYDNDGAVTDRNGYFYIKFKSKGDARYYYTHISSPDGMEEKVFNGTAVRLDSRKFNSIQLTAELKKVLKLHLQVLQNPLDSILVRTSPFRNPFVMRGRQADTTIYTRFEHQSSIPFYILANDRAAGKQRMYGEVINYPQGDTLDHTITINNTADLPFR
ncbi:hypothetical protein [Chitinophaga barathri]|uniref:Carboxypeptidase regulatory-like domain-containing protein n=1 Tax=Chitinophaga barathri TaxID=1647451 RepID=A0A3N4N2A1_9BACT|nr:hypothetical protein [Chitinophaga barathri]RPD41753.1 hypothetical protein EG028_06180 [Chitinophaga barathri]